MVIIVILVTIVIIVIIIIMFIIAVIRVLMQTVLMGEPQAFCRRTQRLQYPLIKEYT